MRFIWKKVLRLALIALATTVITFLMVEILPGDVAYILGGQSATQEDIQAIRKELGHDRNILIRYAIWLGHLVQGDFGRSYLTEEPVLLGLQIGRLIGGAVIIETIFALPGIGRLMVSSIYSRDVMVIQGCILVITVGYVLINTIVDILYLILDPRIRTEPANAV